MAPMSDEERRQLEEQLRALARLMDNAIEIPGTGWRIGLDPILGLFPGAGDAVSLLVSAYIVAAARRLGVPRRVLARMVGNIALDAVVGAVPLLGDIFDAAFKANVRNLRLLGISADPPPARKRVVNEAEGGAHAAG